TVMLVKETAQVARLRLLLVEPKARGLGVGMQLVEECIGFAREAGYRKITLWTHSVLTAARHIYRKTGFRLIDKKAHDEFGKRLVGGQGDVDLRAGTRALRRVDCAKKPPGKFLRKDKPMIDLHYWTTPNGHKITIFLEETGLPYKIFPVNIGKGEQFKREFL